MAAKVERISNSFLQGESIDSSNYEDWSYLVEVEVGTPPQKFQMGLSTVITDSVVLGKNCWSLMCFWLPLYDSAKSTTYVSDGRPFAHQMIDFTGGMVYGNVSQDTFRLGDLVVENYKFGELTKMYGNNLMFKKYNGIIGLAYNTKNMSVSGVDPFLHQAHPDDKSFSLYF